MKPNKIKNLAYEYKSHDPELQDWMESLEAILQVQGKDRAEFILNRLIQNAHTASLNLKDAHTSPYINTLAPTDPNQYPGNVKLEEKIMRAIRWNALAMVVRANRLDSSLGGHISTYASSAHLYETGFNHFFRGKKADKDSDMIFIQGHASPGIYARAFMEGRLTEQELINFRRELQSGGGLSSYPHPWLMPDFWEYPTVSMGLGPIMAIYQARFARYMVNRGLKEENTQKVWAFLGDGEMDEPESLGALHIASREKLNNLVFVINCNLQRLDGPVRGNGKIVQELEGMFRGSGWKVVKSMWSSEWDALFEKDKNGTLARTLEEIVDGDVQKFEAHGPEALRKTLIDHNPENAEILNHFDDSYLATLNRAGHDRHKVYDAYQEAMNSKEQPTVILVQTVKGFGLGATGQAANMTHQKKKLDDNEIKEFRDRFEIPIADKDLKDIPFYRPEDSSEEMQYMMERRKALKGFLPQRRNVQVNLPLPQDKIYQEFYDGTGDREVSTTMAFVKLLANLLKDKEMGSRVVPIIPDEARTFGMESMFRQVGIYAPFGQKYKPIDSKNLLFYKETQNGQILEEGINEAGAMASFIAAGTSHENHDCATIPFFIYYSMFGFQRVGDLIWAAADQRTRGFMLGGTAGRTTLAGEGLQHQDGHSHLNAYAFPNVKAYDPAFAFETALIVKEGLKRMYQNNEDIFYYITLENENYAQPAMPEGCESGVLDGMYKFKTSSLKANSPMVTLMGSGSIMTECLKAQSILEKRFNLATEAWSVTSYKELYKNATETEREDLLQGKETKRSYVSSCLKNAGQTVVAASDYVKALPESIAKWVEQPYVCLGTDGFGLSENRSSLRKHFEVDAEAIAFYAIASLHKNKIVSDKVFKQAQTELHVQVKKGKPYGLI